MAAVKSHRMTHGADRFALLRTEFLKVRGGGISEDDADHFVFHLTSLVEENPAAQKKPAKTRDRQLLRARAALLRARIALSDLDRLQLYVILGGKMSAARRLLRQFETVANLASDFDTALDRPIDVESESRAMTIATGLRQVFRIFDLRISDSESSFAAYCLGEVFKASGIDATPDSVRAHLRRTAKIGQKSG